MSLLLPPLWAIHIADGLLTAPWLLGGFLLAAALVGYAARGLSEDEIPRVAVMASAFFIASLIHLRLGPSSVHLLLNGLLGVVLGRRAPLAILVGLALQAVLFAHGGFLTLGVNTCIMSVPALLAGWLFAPLHRLPWLRRAWFRGSLVGLASLAWLLSMVFAVVLLSTNPFAVMVVSPETPTSRPVAPPLPDFGPALAVTLHPLTLLLAGLAAIALAWWEGRRNHTPEFALGLFLGVLSVLATLVLNAVALVGGGHDPWYTWVVAVLVVHLPLAVLEGVVLGFTVAFLVRVKPELLNGYRPAPLPEAPVAEPTVTHSGSLPVRVPLLLAVSAALLLARPASAHRLEAEYKVLRSQKVQIESWFETGDTPQKATVKVFRPDGRALAEGPLDEKSGQFVFRYRKAEPLRVVVDAPGGHRKELAIPERALHPPRHRTGVTAIPRLPPERREVAATPIPPPRSWQDQLRDLLRGVLPGVTFVLALAAICLTVLNARKLRATQEAKRRIRGAASDAVPSPGGDEEACA